MNVPKNPSRSCKDSYDLASEIPGHRFSLSEEQPAHTRKGEIEGSRLTDLIPKRAVLLSVLHIGFTTENSVQVLRKTYD